MFTSHTNQTYSIVNLNLKSLRLKKHKYVLHVGSFDKRKNILTLVKAFEKLITVERELNIKLVLVGKQKVNGNSKVANEIINFIKKGI